jgi:hypothetical protein
LITIFPAFPGPIVAVLIPAVFANDKERDVILISPLFPKMLLLKIMPEKPCTPTLFSEIAPFGT